MVRIKGDDKMILSTKGRYGLKMMFELSLRYGSGAVPLNEIAKSLNLSDTYLEQLVAILRKAGYVKSFRGAQGGYELSKNPKDITIGEIIRTLEGPLAPAECVIDEEPDCDRADYCVTRIIWGKIMDGINNVIDGITLHDMIDDYNKIINKQE